MTLHYVVVCKPWDDRIAESRLVACQDCRQLLAMSFATVSDLTNFREVTDYTVLCRVCADVRSESNPPITRQVAGPKTVAEFMRYVRDREQKT